MFSPCASSFKGSSRLGLFIKRNEVFSMVFRVGRGLGLKSRGRGKLAVNVAEKASLLGNIGSIAIKTVYSPHEITGRAQPSVQISEITDTILLRRAQMFQ